MLLKLKKSTRAGFRFQYEEHAARGRGVTLPLQPHLRRIAVAKMAAEKPAKLEPAPIDDRLEVAYHIAMGYRHAQPGGAGWIMLVELVAWLDLSADVVTVLKERGVTTDGTPRLATLGVMYVLGGAAVRDTLAAKQGGFYWWVKAKHLKKLRNKGRARQVVEAACAEAKLLNPPKRRS